MKIGVFFGITCAIVLHIGFLLFGGLLFGMENEDHGSLQQVELLSEEDLAKEEDKEEKEKQEEQEDIVAQEEEPPDAAEIIRNLEMLPAQAPELEAASLSAIESALSGLVGSGDFADVLGLASGGRIGGTGKGGALDESLENAFSLAEIDQKPRLIFQAVPLYPAEMRGKNLEGVVTVIFIVDEDGKVIKPKVIKSNHPAFEKPTLDALQQWKFEPAIRGGKRVPCKMRVPLRFQPS